MVNFPVLSSLSPFPCILHSFPDLPDMLLNLPAWLRLFLLIAPDLSFYWRSCLPDYVSDCHLDFLPTLPVACLAMPVFYFKLACFSTYFLGWFPPSALPVSTNVALWPQAPDSWYLLVDPSAKPVPAVAMPSCTNFASYISAFLLHCLLVTPVHTSKGPWDTAVREDILDLQAPLTGMW